MIRSLVAAVVLGGCAHDVGQQQAAPQRKTTLVVPDDIAKCERLRDEGRFRVRLRDVEALHVFKTLADATCFTFAVEQGVKATVTIQPSEDEPIAEWNWSEYFNAVRVELEKQGVDLKEDGIRRYRVSAR